MNVAMASSFCNRTLIPHPIQAGLALPSSYSFPGRSAPRIQTRSLLHLPGARGTRRIPMADDKQTASQSRRNPLKRYQPSGELFFCPRPAYRRRSGRLPEAGGTWVSDLPAKKTIPRDVRVPRKESGPSPFTRSLITYADLRQQPNTSQQLRLVDERFVGLTPDLFVSMAAASTVDGSGTRYVQRPLALKAHPRQLCLFKLLSKWLLIVLFIQLVNHVPYYGKAFSQVSDFTPIASC